MDLKGETRIKIISPSGASDVLRGSLEGPLPRGRASQFVGFGVALPRNMLDRKSQRLCQLPADPMEGIQTRAAALVFALHLPNDDLRIRVHVQRLGIQVQRALKGFEQSQVFGDIVILMTDPLGNSNRCTIRRTEHHSNTRRPWIAQRTAVYMSHEN